MEQSVKQRIADIRRGNVPTGYRKIKRIGIFPEKWSKTKIGDFIQFYNEKSTKNNQYPVLTSARSGLFFQKDYFEDQVTTENNTGYNIIPRGFFTYRSRSDDGSFYFNCNTIIDRGVISCFYPVFQFDTTKVESNYIFICLNELLKEQVFCEVAGTSQLVLSEKMLSQMTLVLPPLEEQRRIAEILVCCDRVIALKKELIAEKKKQKKALMQKLLNPNSGFRLPGFSGEWKTVKLKEVCDINTSSLSENTNPDKSFYYLDLATVDKGKIVNEPAFVAFGNAPCRARRLFKKGDILFSTVRPYLCGFLFADFVADDYVASTGFAILTPQIGNMIGKLLYHHLFSDNIILQTQNLLSGTNYPALNSYDVENLYINIPKDIKEQQAIADILSAADKEIDLLEQELAQQEQKKKSLMQLLLTGIVRV